MASNNKDEKDDTSKDQEAPPSSSRGSSFSSDTISIEKIRQFFVDKLNLGSTDEGDANKSQILEAATTEALVKHWKKGGFKKIVTMVGAGISTSAGIPDFRSPGIGLYDNLMKYNLPYPEAIFDLDYFRQNPTPFFKLAKELYPGSFKPTPSHYFVRLLQEKELLVRHYTQNIDTLDRIAGISGDKIVEAHGTFYTGHCMDCRKEYSLEWMRDEIFQDKIPECPACKGVVKPDIVFFGENLPEKFYTLPHRDFAECDLLIIMGTSLTVQPFASLVDYASDECVRLLINREKVGGGKSVFFRAMMFGEGLCFDLPGNKRDVAIEGDCDDGVFLLAEKLGFADELKELVKAEHARIDAEEAAKKKGGVKEKTKVVESTSPPEKKDVVDDKDKEAEKKDDDTPKGENSKN